MVDFKFISISKHIDDLQNLKTRKWITSEELKSANDRLFFWLKFLTGDIDKYCFMTIGKGLDIRIYTDEYEYIIFNNYSKYISCVFLLRGCLPGESVNRGNDLTDGEFCDKTMKNIILGIINNELKQIKYVQY